MATTSEILRKARTTLFSHASLWMPAFMVILLQDMLLPAAALGGEPGQALAGLLSAMGAIMIGAGWLAMIGAALRDEKPGLAVFAEGVNARWLPVLLGAFVYWMLMLAILFLFYAYGENHYGTNAIVEWMKTFLAAPTAQQQAMLDPAVVSAPVRGWMNLIAFGGAAFIAVNAFLVFWQPLVVLQGRGWLAGWAQSGALFGRRFGQVLLIGALHISTMFLARAMMGSAFPIASLVGVSLYVGTVAYFTIVYAAIVEDAFPREGQLIDIKA